MSIVSPEGGGFSAANGTGTYHHSHSKSPATPGIGRGITSVMTFFWVFLGEIHIDIDMNAYPNIIAAVSTIQLKFEARRFLS